MKSLAVALCLAVLVVLSVAPASSAAAVHTVGGQVAQPYAGWAATSKEPAPNADVMVVGDNSGCPSRGADTVGACAAQTGPFSATIWMAAGYGFRSRGTFTHELGHVFDYTMMNDSARQTFLRLLGTPSRSWRDAPNSPHEQFAEAYRICSLYGSDATDIRRTTAGYGYAPSAQTNRRICKLIYRVGVGD